MTVPARNMPERISIFTSFRPKDLTLIDDSSLVNVKNKLLRSETYYQSTAYRLRNLARRINGFVSDFDTKYRANVKRFDLDKKKELCTADAIDVLERAGKSEILQSL